MGKGSDLFMSRLSTLRQSSLVQELKSIFLLGLGLWCSWGINATKSIFTPDTPCSVKNDEELVSINDEPRCCICLGIKEEGKLLTLSCQHTAHLDCLRDQLDAKWSGKRISFRYLDCGECRQPLYHKKLGPYISSHLKLKRQVEE